MYPLSSHRLPTINTPIKADHLSQLMNLRGPVVITPESIIYIRVTLCDARSMGLDKCVMTRIYHHGIIQSTFTALKTVSSALPLLHPWLRTFNALGCGRVLCLPGPVWCSVLPSVGADSLGLAGGWRDVCVGLPTSSNGLTAHCLLELR